MFIYEKLVLLPKPSFGTQTINGVTENGPAWFNGFGKSK